MYDLNDIGQAKALSRRMMADIDAYSKEKFNDGMRSHLGASIVGHDCARYVWYTFRWLFLPEFDGRMLRLFNRGHREEPFLISLLEGTGWRISAETPDGKQHRISDVEEHFGGSKDGHAEPPARYQILQPTMLCEFKTKATGRGFDKLEELGVMSQAPQHFAQMCVYGYKSGFEFAIYMVVNKNDDKLHIEVVKLDLLYGAELIRKGAGIITQAEPPRRIASTASYIKCKFCDAKGLCWEGVPPIKNCRSCKYAAAAPAGQWYCNGWQSIIPKEAIPQGCDRWEPLPV